MNIGATGGAGEDAALALFIEKGFQMVERNFQTRWGEIDLIVRSDRYLVFVEVKTRTKASKTTGVAAMSAAKKKKIFKSALLYLQSTCFDLQPRFDVVDIEGHWTICDEREIFVADRISHYENAFGSEVYDGFI